MTTRVRHCGCTVFRFRFASDRGIDGHVSVGRTAIATGGGSRCLKTRARLIVPSQLLQRGT